MSGYAYSFVTAIIVSYVMRKSAFCICKSRDAGQVTVQLISAFVLATYIVQSLYFLKMKFQASSHLCRLYRVCVGPGRKP